MRDALSLMDQLIAFGGGALSEAHARSMLGTIDRGHTTKILDALSRQDGRAVLDQVRELDKDAPDYDRALAEMAAYLQRIAIVQVVPDAAPQDEEFDGEALTRLAAAMSAEDVQLAIRSPSAAAVISPWRRTAHRFRNEPVADAGISSRFRRRRGGRRPPAAQSARSTAGAAARSAAPAVRPASVDAANWGAVVEAAGLTGMARQFALNCTPAAFDNRVLRLQFDPAAAHHRTPQNEEKLLQGLSGYLGPDIRVISRQPAPRSSRPRASARRPNRTGLPGLRRRSMRTPPSRGCGSVWGGDRHRVGQAAELGERRA